MTVTATFTHPSNDGTVVSTSQPRPRSTRPARSCTGTTCASRPLGLYTDHLHRTQGRLQRSRRGQIALIRRARSKSPWAVAVAVAADRVVIRAVAAVVADRVVLAKVELRRHSAKAMRCSDRPGTDQNAPRLFLRFRLRESWSRIPVPLLKNPHHGATFSIRRRICRGSCSAGAGYWGHASSVQLTGLACFSGPPSLR